MRLWYSIVLLLASVAVSWSQCSEFSLLKMGGDYRNVDFIDHCPAYNFHYDNQSNEPWKLQGVKPASSGYVQELNEVKQHLENKLQDQIGNQLFSKLELQSISLSAYDSISKLGSRYPVVDMAKCMTKYFFYYHLTPTKDVTYCVGIALDDYYNIISDLPFPKDLEDTVFDQRLNVCNVIQLAKETGTPITPIQDVYFDFDYQRSVYVWVVRQKVQNPFGQVLEYNEVTIEATDGSLTTSYKKTVEN